MSPISRGQILLPREPKGHGCFGDSLLIELQLCAAALGFYMQECTPVLILKQIY